MVVAPNSFSCLKRANSTVAKLPPSVNCYLDDMVRLLERKFGKGAVVSGVIFGSQMSQGSCSPVSDCDVSVVVQDRISHRQIKAMQPYLRALEIKHGFNKYERGLVGIGLRVVEITTGMFVSHFICREKELRRRDFAGIFNTNRFITKLLAPWKIVMGSVGDFSEVFYGEDLRYFLQNTHPGRGQLLKSLIMNLSLSLGAIFIAPLRETNWKYTLEAIKWSVNANGYYLFHNGTALRKLVPHFVKLGISPQFLHCFLVYRKKPRRDIRFLLKAPWIITKMHLLALRVKRTQTSLGIKTKN